MQPGRLQHDVAPHQQPRSPTESRVEAVALPSDPRRDGAVVEAGCQGGGDLDPALETFREAQHLTMGVGPSSATHDEAVEDADPSRACDEGGLEHEGVVDVAALGAMIGPRG